MWRFLNMGFLACMFGASVVIGPIIIGPVAIAATTANGAVAADLVSPYKLIEDVTAEVLLKIEVHRAKTNDAGSEAEKEKDLSCFFDGIDTILSRVIDFDWIARNVMGPYGKTASSAQRATFSEAFRAGLVATYGRGLLSYSDQEIVVLSGDEDYTIKRKITVRQEIRGADTNYPLEYTMGLSKVGEWRVINVIINGINLGKIFRKQFVQASQKNGGDIDTVIANWGSEVI
jgi:phospholipid transport system substrate-binding protein